MGLGEKYSTKEVAVMLEPERMDAGQEQTTSEHSYKSGFFCLDSGISRPLNMSPLSSSVVEVNVSAPTARWPDGVQTKCRNEPELPPGTHLPCAPLGSAPCLVSEPGASPCS